MHEIGFWDYTCPRHGSLEHYSAKDWDDLLDDMSVGGFNSLVIGVKWLTTGYRSRLPWLDQDPSNTTIATDNRLLLDALTKARSRGIRAWILIVASIFNVEAFGIASAQPGDAFLGSRAYDLDQPVVSDRMVELCDEIGKVFGQHCDGMVIELEFCDSATPHRIPGYNAWASANGRPDFEPISKIELQPRSYPFSHWRDFTTSRRVDMLGRIESVLRDGGFQGELSTIAEIDNGIGSINFALNLKMLRSALPHWKLLTYDSIYDRRVNRLASMDFCIEYPHSLGFDVQFLTRGVMTWTWPPDGPSMNLLEQWQMSIEDAGRFNPETFWFLGADARLDGAVCSDRKLAAWGFEDARSARRKLMQVAGGLVAGIA